ncbi:ester cyclase [Mycolicibacterium smegmatis]|uniref:ester cyclase n=1 Tax=Mycolicibacterium smegmatis TaxID=1772 RepID=UPI0005DA2DC8|nr:ester cyclase [Mycolicibacterium smegmatis]MDF1898075.1 ester cyclase [Mycolicibacterium smegmatis]MDF1908441.1 ester cyclase [Mycolicibacterium smegmatis]MDF1916834.1 ester cyclase [Mycolicibacterium smegmatis]MDF1923232.1 ester cyclase [Mycolicibacterium smegmatis]UAK52798.1 ester cyclase [Mycolicibacterium smegmatis]
MSDNETRRKRISSAWGAAWDTGDVDALDDLLSESYQRISGTGSTQNRDEFKSSITATRSAFPDLATVVDEVVVEGDRAAIRWHSTGSHEHSFLGVPATKREVTVSGATFARFDNDRIVEEHVTWDPRALLTALGIIAIGQDR